jgi:hypothetical protein
MRQLRTLPMYPSASHHTRLRQFHHFPSRAMLPPVRLDPESRHHIKSRCVKSLPKMLV